MTIFQGSRYEREPVAVVADTSGNHRQTVYMRSPGKRYNSSPFYWTLYIVRDNDRLDAIADQCYGAADLWWLIADANPELFDPLNLDTGTVLRIPSYRQLHDVLLPSSSVHTLTVTGEATSGISLR